MQKGYEWLWKEPGPVMLQDMLNIFGTVEAPGAKDNPVIMAWAKETGQKGYVHDSVPWCGLAMAVAAKRAGWPYNPGGNALWALNWATWGDHAEIPMLGDVLVFGRTGGGHVTQYVGEDATCFHILGGNQTDQVNIVRKPKADLIQARRAPWKVAQPANVRRVFLSPAGAPLSTNEA
jgi:uncharacterized protein (TIGR02594 family)